MWADYHLKPFQGSKFCITRRKIMSYLVDYDDDVERRLTHPILMPKFEADTGVVSLVKSTMKKAVVDCNVTSEARIRNSSLGTPSH